MAQADAGHSGIEQNDFHSSTVVGDFSCDDGKGKKGRKGKKGSNFPGKGKRVEREKRKGKRVQFPMLFKFASGSIGLNVGMYGA